MNKPVLVLTLLHVVLGLLIAIGVGVFLYRLRDLLWRRRLQKDFDRIKNRPIRNESYGHRTTDVSQTQAVGEPGRSRGIPGLIALESLIIRNFKNIAELKMDFMRESSLAGEWTCIAGINGAGKTSILQAICMALLGSELVPELGRTRLGRALRRTSEGTGDAEIEAIMRQDGRRMRLYIPLMRVGTEQRGFDVEGSLDSETLRRQPDYASMVETWARLRKQVFVCFGASRNVSDFRDPRHVSLSRITQRQMTLFDPLTQLASVDVLLEGGPQAKLVLETLYRLVRTVLNAESLRVESSTPGDKLRFSMHDASIDVIDLPDGFRSTVAWLAELCADWHERAKGTKVDSDPSAITGIVLLDEIGLHLHPSMEKALVPQLRKALPRVQFIVSTHSPMVLSSFDRDELIILDAGAPGGTRALDRQVFGLTMDDVYAWLMNTSPGSPVMEQMLAEGPDPQLAVYLYQSKDVNEERALALIEEREKRVAKLRRQGQKNS